MGKPTGFMEYARLNDSAVSPEKRISNYNEFHKDLDIEERQRQGGRCMNCGVPFCQANIPELAPQIMAGCPLANLIPEWNDEIYSGNIGHALSRLLKTNNFPEFTSRVCPALCENACLCGMNGDAVTVRENEFTVIEHAYENGLIKANPPKTRTDKKVAVIGSGPSGLTVADQLNKRGHNVTVYEKSDRIGGLLMYGIPNMKLDKKVIQRKMNIMVEEGIKFVTGVNVGTDISAAEILESYDAVVLCCGSEKPRDLGYDMRVEGVSYAVPYLAASTKEVLDGTENPLNAKGKNVVIIGAGDTSNDCLATAIRQGAKSVCRVDIKPEPKVKKTLWQELPFPVSYAEEEEKAVFGSNSTEFESTVKEIEVDKGGKLKSVTIRKIEFKNGIIKDIAGTQRKIPAERLFIASGFVGCDEKICSDFGVSVERGRAERNADSKVFTAGDMRRGQSLVVWAIAEGRSAAKDVDNYLMGYTNMLK